MVLSLKKLPLVSQNEDCQTVIVHSFQEYELAAAALQTHFGHRDFRPHQWEIVENAMKGRNQLVLMSTGMSIVL